MMLDAIPLRILVVEDDPDKLGAVVDLLGRFEDENSFGSFSIVTSTCFSEAQSQLSTSHFDIVIMDLRIPVVPGDDPMLANSLSLYRFMKAGSLSKPFLVLGLTSADETDVTEKFSASPAFAIQRFDTDGAWLSVVKDRIEFVQLARVGLERYIMNRPGLDVLIVTARRRNEFDPIVAEIDWIGGVKSGRRDLGGLANFFGKVEVGSSRPISLGIVCLDEMGLSHSAAVVSWLTCVLRPRLLSMLGMCCGLHKIVDPVVGVSGGKTKLGDVIVATSTCCWDEGKYEEYDPNLLGSALFNNRALDKSPDPEFVRSLVRFLDRAEDSIGERIKSFYAKFDSRTIELGLVGGVKFVPDGDVKWGPVVSGACVVDSQGLIEEIQSRFPRALGLEMEAHSVYSAVSVIGGFRPASVVIKGVADFGDGTKAKAVQPIASAASYAVFFLIMGWFFSEVVDSQGI